MISVKVGDKVYKEFEIVDHFGKPIIEAMVLNLEHGTSLEYSCRLDKIYSEKDLPCELERRMREYQKEVYMAVPQRTEYRGHEERQQMLFNLDKYK